MKLVNIITSDKVFKETPFYIYEIEDKDRQVLPSTCHEFVYLLSRNDPTFMSDINKWMKSREFRTVFKDPLIHFYKNKNRIIKKLETKFETDTNKKYVELSRKIARIKEERLEIICDIMKIN